MTTTADQPVPPHGRPILGILRNCSNCGAKVIDPAPKQKHLECPLCGSSIPRGTQGVISP